MNRIREVCRSVYASPNVIGHESHLVGKTIRRLSEVYPEDPVLVGHGNVEHIGSAAIVAGARRHLDVFRAPVAGRARGRRHNVGIHLYGVAIERKPYGFSGAIGVGGRDLERVQLAGCQVTSAVRDEAEDVTAGPCGGVRGGFRDSVHVAFRVDPHPFMCACPERR
jgi:hypothetical protein